MDRNEKPSSNPFPRRAEIEGRNNFKKLNSTHQLLAYADDVNILGGSIHTPKENAEALVAATREIGLEVNADKTKYMVMSRDQNSGIQDEFTV